MSTLRGTNLEIKNRFETRSIEAFDDGWGDTSPLELPVVQTQFLPDHTKSILSKNSSPDIGFTYSINPYRGCEHGCAYCYARPTHEYLGFNAGIDFESKIMVKHDAADLLRAAFEARSWKPQVISMSGNTDCYQPAERDFGITRKLLEVFLEFRNPVGIITKNALILRDIDLLQELAQHKLVVVFFSINSLNRDLARKLEPRTASPERRLTAIKRLSEVGVHCGVIVGPVIPGLNDDQIMPVLQAASEAGARSCGYNMLRLPYAVRPIFLDWLDKNVPGESQKVRTRLQMVRSGELSNARFGSRMIGEGAYADYVARTFKVAKRRYHLDQPVELSIEGFRKGQRHTGELDLFSDLPTN